MSRRWMRLLPLTIGLTGVFALAALRGTPQEPMTPSAPVPPAAAVAAVPEPISIERLVGDAIAAEMVDNPAARRAAVEKLKRDPAAARAVIQQQARRAATARQMRMLSTLAAEVGGE